MNWIRWGSLTMFLGVCLGAFGAHALKSRLTIEQQHIYQTAVLYHLVHGLALFVVGWLSLLKPTESLVRSAGWSFAIGLVVFSGSLYALSVTGIKKLGMITPLGGLAFLAGWLCLALSAR